LPEKRLGFLITNDDGYQAPGLGALYRALIVHGDVTVVAPRLSHSCRGHAVTDHDPISICREASDGMDPMWVVQGTPADCTRIGLLELMQDGQPDVVISGINRGANLGVDVYYSGTVAAAREATILGRKAIAVSQYVKRGYEVDWGWTGRMAGAVLRRILNMPLPSGCLWNVNLPALPPGTWPASLAFAPASTDPQDVRFQQDDHGPNGERTCHFAGRYSDRPAREHTDVHLVFSGHATATLLQLQTTAAACVPAHEPFPQDDGAAPTR
jgi:5'-nucleotidase